MKIAMKTKPREPQVGDVWLRNGSGEHLRVLDVKRDGCVKAHSERRGHLDFDPGEMERWCVFVEWKTLTLAERESLGIAPTISDDDRTPLEKMTAERDALWVEVRNMRDAYRRMQARMVTLAEHHVCSDEEQIRRGREWSKEMFL